VLDDAIPLNRPQEEVRADVLNAQAAADVTHGCVAADAVDLYVSFRPLEAQIAAHVADRDARDVPDCQVAADALDLDISAEVRHARIAADLLHHDIDGWRDEHAAVTCAAHQIRLPAAQVLDLRAIAIHDKLAAFTPAQHQVAADILHDHRHGDVDFLNSFDHVASSSYGRGIRPLPLVRTGYRRVPTRRDQALSGSDNALDNVSVNVDVHPLVILNVLDLDQRASELLPVERVQHVFHYIAIDFVGEARPDLHPETHQPQRHVNAHA